MEDENKSVKVNCSFCGKEMECPEDMLENAEKHMCFECFQSDDEELDEEDISKVHVDIPLNELKENMPELMADKLVKEMFPQLWKEGKDDFKEMSKKEIAEQMFGEGAFMAFSSMVHSMLKEEEKMREKKQE